MNRKYLPYVIIGSLVILTVGGYFLVRWQRNKSGDAQKNDRKIKIVRNN
jgi:hypothetical protein